MIWAAGAGAGLAPAIYSRVGVMSVMTEKPRAVTQDRSPGPATISGTLVPPSEA